MMWVVRIFIGCGYLTLLTILIFIVPHSVALEEGDPCMLMDNIPGSCQTASQCKSTMLKYMERGIITMNDISTCRLGVREEIICCPTVECCPSIHNLGSAMTTEDINQSSTTARVIYTERAAVRACRKIREGRRSSPISTQVLGGVPVEEGYYPHVAAIAISIIDSVSYSCGGTLISRRHVLTAAHCVSSPNRIPLHVRLGTVDIDNVNDDFQDIAILPHNIRVHPGFVDGSKYNDIAILELAEDAKFSYSIYPACLETSLTDPPATSKVFVAGWGVTNRNTRAKSKILLHTQLDVIPVQSCNVTYMRQPTSARFLRMGINNNLICAGDTSDSGRDSCTGDSGGPLTLETDMVTNHFTILGIVSSGFSCGTRVPGLYTRVASYLDFIESVVWPNDVVD